MSYEEAAETAARYAQKIMDMQPVYDAAMAVVQRSALTGRNGNQVVMLTVDARAWDNLKLAIEYACCRAKEGKDE